MSPMHDKLECGRKEHAQARIGMLVLEQATQARRWNKQEHGYVKLPEQWRSNWERTSRELKVWERKQRAKD